MGRKSKIEKQEIIESILPDEINENTLMIDIKEIDKVKEEVKEELEQIIEESKEESKESIKESIKKSKKVRSEAQIEATLRMREKLLKKREGDIIIKEKVKLDHAELNKKIKKKLFSVRVKDEMERKIKEIADESDDEIVLPPIKSVFKKNKKQTISFV